MKRDTIEVNLDIYKSLISENEKLTKEIEQRKLINDWYLEACHLGNVKLNEKEIKIRQLEKEIETLKNNTCDHYREAGAYGSALNNEQWKDKYFQEKMDHTTTKARIVFAQHILNGNRDEKVLEYCSK